MPLWVLQKRAEMDGAVRDAGYVFERPDDWKVPPMDTVRDPKDATKFIDAPIAVKVDATIADIRASREESAKAEQERLAHANVDAGVVPLPPTHPVAVAMAHDASADAAKDAKPAQDDLPLNEGEPRPTITRPEDLPAKGIPVTPPVAPFVPDPNAPRPPVSP